MREFLNGGETFWPLQEEEKEAGKIFAARDPNVCIYLFFIWDIRGENL